MEARLLADCAACGAPPGLRTHAKGRAPRRALSSILTGASPVALTPDGRAGRVLCEKQRADVWLMAHVWRASVEPARPKPTTDWLTEAVTDMPMPGGHISLQR